MDLLVDLLLLLAALMLVVRANSERDEVWAICLRFLAVIAVIAVITSNRGQPLSILLLVLALGLPRADRYEKLPPSPKS
jgi:hypothetical protein